MLQSGGEDALRAFTQSSYQETVTQVTQRVWHVLGYGHSNAIFIEGNSTVILIDTLDTLERGQRLRALIEHTVGKPVKTILFTHGHPDHQGGAGAFSDLEPEVIAFTPVAPLLARTEQLNRIQSLRGGRQFGYQLTDEEAISQGIGIREGIPYGQHRAFVKPTTLYREEKVSRTIDGIPLELVRVPGETEDQIMVWLPGEKVLCSGDTYYGCWPNLYAIRGSQYRDIATWIQSLGTLLSYPADALLPGHTAAILGRDQVQEVLGNFRGAIDFVLQKTLEGMDAGKDMDTLASEIHLPPEYAFLPYLGEFYGCVDWTVRAIYTGYLGWFDGNPTHLHPLPPIERAEKTIALMGGPEKVLTAAREALADGDFQWCAELCDLLLPLGVEPARQVKAKALLGLARLETSANGRHYYISYAKELEAGGPH